MTMLIRQGMSAFQHTAARRRLVQSLLGNLSEAKVSTHSRPKAAGLYDGDVGVVRTWFQHTAARRRLDRQVNHSSALGCVSTHSRPKAAGSIDSMLTFNY